MRNGELTSDDLVAIDGLYLAPAAAAGWNAMRASCRAATGVDLRIAKPYGAYRSLVAQRFMYKNSHLYGVGIAAPGYSTHGFGMAVDATLTSYNAAAGWLRENCTRFGFAIPPSNDKNHFVHKGTTITGGNIMATPEEVWKVPVKRGGVNIPALQELADAKTQATAAAKSAAEILTLVKNFTLPPARELTEAELEAIAAKVAAKIKVPTKGTITLTP